MKSNFSTFTYILVFFFFYLKSISLVSLHCNNQNNVLRCIKYAMRGVSIVLFSSLFFIVIDKTGD